MQAYMKSAMPYHGVPMPALRKIEKEVFANLRLESAEQWHAAVLELWRGAEKREERYAALGLAGDRRFRAYSESMAALALYEELIETGAWWDLVDDVATHRLGALLRAHPAEMRHVLLGWRTHPDLWHRRAAIIAQAGLKRDTDWELLQTCIEPNRGDDSFWIRKAIGWALREYSKFEPDRVAGYLATTELSGLSRRVGSARLPAPPAGTSPAGRSRAPG
jgi:3-methyladenine DNA glycosylase AlkD